MLGLKPVDYPLFALTFREAHALAVFAKLNALPVRKFHGWRGHFATLKTRSRR